MKSRPVFHPWRQPVRVALATSLLFALGLSAAEQTTPTPAPRYDRKEAHDRIRRLEPRMSYLENGEIKVGVNLAIGGAITFLSHRGGPNLINSFDWGRQVQMSFYSGPSPFAPDGRQPDPHWAKLGWNPIQSGDVGGNPSRVLEHRNDGRTLFVKCVPMQWPHSGVPGECTYEWTLSLAGPTVTVQARLRNARPDATQYPAKSQELPAVYTNGVWYRLFSYTGDAPFTQQPVERIPKRNVAPGEFPWSRFNATEHWAALVNDQDEGLGIWAPGVVSFLGGFVGREGSGGPGDGPTGYIAPVRHEVLDHNIVYDYTFTLIAGSLTSIRDWVYDHAVRPMPFRFEFARDREHWYPTGQLKDAGWPLSGAWPLRYEAAGGKNRVMSPIGFWRTEELPRVYLRATHHTTVTEAELHFDAFGPDHAVHSGVVRFPIRGDGQPHTYEIELANAPDYVGAVRQFQLVPAVNARAGDTVEIDYIGRTPP